MEIRRYGEGGWYYTVDQDQRAYPRRATRTRMLLKVGLARLAAAGICETEDVSRGGILVIPDPVCFDVIRDCHPGKTIIMIGAQPWCRHFSISGNVARVTLAGKVGIRITSTTSDAFLREWIEHGEPR